MSNTKRSFEQVRFAHAGLPRRPPTFQPRLGGVASPGKNIPINTTKHDTAMKGAVQDIRYKVQSSGLTFLTL